MCGAMLGMVTTVAGGLFQAMGSMQQGAQQAEQLKAQAAFNNRQASIEAIESGYKSYQLGRQTQRIVGAQEAGYAKAGIEGESPVDTIKATLSEADMDKQAIRFSTELEQGNYKYRAKINEMEAKEAKSAGYMGALGALVGTGTKLVSSFVQV